MITFRTASTGIGPIERFYNLFLISTNFSAWLHDRDDKFRAQSRRNYLAKLEAMTDMGEWVSSMGGREDDISDLVTRLEKEIVRTPHLSEPSTTLT